MAIIRTFCLIVAITLFTPAALVAAEPAQTPLDKTAIEKILWDILKDKPEIIIQAIESYRAKQEAEKQKKAQEALASRQDELRGGPLTPIGGNPNGTITVVEFFDYNCGFCKRVFPSILELLRTDQSVRYVFMEFPILGPESLLAARAALVVWKLDKSKYMPFHTALMASRGRLNQKRIMRLAEQTGLKPETIRKHMNDPEISQALQKTQNLAQALNITGTPAFIIGDRLVPGAIGLDEIKQIISEVRGAS